MKNNKYAVIGFLVAFVGGAVFLGAFIFYASALVHSVFSNHGAGNVENVDTEFAKLKMEFEVNSLKYKMEKAGMKKYIPFSREERDKLVELQNDAISDYEAFLSSAGRDTLNEMQKFDFLRGIEYGIMLANYFDKKER